LYVYHFPIIWFAARMADWGIKDPYLKPLTALVALAATILLASLSYSLLERPVLNLKDRFFTFRKPPTRDEVIPAAADS